MHALPFCCSNLLLSLTLPVRLQLAAMDAAASDANQLPAAPERRLAENGRPYTRIQFLWWYGAAGDQVWAEAEHAAHGPPADRDAAQLLAVPLPRDAAPLPVVLLPQHVIAIQQAEAARGPPRSLHRLARGALNEISNRPTRSTVNLDGCFPWVQYVAAHRQSAKIIGPGITHAHAVFWPDTNDGNRGGAPRLDFCFYRTDGTFCRVHPGRRRSRDAQLRIESL